MINLLIAVILFIFGWVYSMDEIEFASNVLEFVLGFDRNFFMCFLIVIAGC